MSQDSNSSGGKPEYIFTTGAVVSVKGVGGTIYSGLTSPGDPTPWFRLNALVHGLGGTNGFGGNAVHISVPASDQYPDSRLDIHSDGTAIFGPDGGERKSLSDDRGNHTVYCNGKGASILLVLNDPFYTGADDTQPSQGGSRTQHTSGERNAQDGKSILDGTA